MSGDSRYGLLYNDYEYTPIIRLSFGLLACITILMPFLAFIFCVMYSEVYNFESATHTHCQVYNLLPSLSAAIGNFTPQKEVWQLAILFQTLPRLYVAVLYLELNQARLHQKDQYLGNIAFALNVVEVLALAILSFWTSSKHYAVHEKAFITFIITSVLYMVITCILQNRHKGKDHRDKLSLKLKKRLVVTNIACIFIAGYFFLRHNAFCEPYVYSWFALSEYIVVLSNMAYHMTAYLDFKSKDLLVYKYGVRTCERWEYADY